ncbi:hypothetical protein [Streptomyces sp. 2A115]|uniref:hypothetical protein n=1 Tax=Streptomyces sp. 2A115 TaxID=3457439 RepID=UPI003FD184E6
MHGFWKETDAQARQLEKGSLHRDLALAGVALMLLVLIAHVGSDLGLTITGPLCGID